MRIRRRFVLAPVLFPLTLIGGCSSREQPVSATTPAVRTPAPTHAAVPVDVVDPNLAKIDDLYAGYRVSFPDLPEITAADLQRRIDEEQIVLVDCREEKERAVSMIPGAITREAFEADPARYRDHVVVAYCTIGYRSGVFGQTIAESHNVLNLKGGVLEWAYAGGVFLAPDGRPTRLVHVYGRTWDLLPENYTSVY